MLIPDVTVVFEQTHKVVSWATAAVFCAIFFFFSQLNEKKTYTEQISGVPPSLTERPNLSESPRTAT